MYPPVLFILITVFTSWCAIIWRYRMVLVRHWREPVLRYPVVIIESDDWGPGPTGQARRLAEVCELLSRYRDATGRCPVMTVGVVLGMPDVAAIRLSGMTHYQRVTLEDARYRDVRAALQDGAHCGVLALQLHGMEHLWPPTFVRLAQRDGEVRCWLEQSDDAGTETLPPQVQSRWIDGSTLPSQPLDAATIEPAVREEVATFARIFGKLPAVAVPPTFIWNAAVERAWAAVGVRFVVTPGRRYTSRNPQGQPDGIDRQMLNGELGDGGVRYLVRDIYFEPTLGHQAGRVLAEIQQHYRLGRPALLETHHYDFLGEESAHERSLRQLESLLNGLLRELPRVRFMSTEELGEAYLQGNSELFDWCWLARIHIWLRRLAILGRLRKLGWVTGLVVPAGLAYWLTVPAYAWRQNSPRPLRERGRG